MRIFRRRFSQLRQRLTNPLLVAALACTVACGSDKDEGSKIDGNGNGNGSGNGSGSGGATSGSGGAGSGSGGNASGSGSTSGTGGSTDPNNSACGLATNPGSTNGGTHDFDECTGISMEAEAVAADIFILLDRSTSMGDHRVSEEEDAPTRWEAITEALTEFISAPETANLRIGLQYFPHFEEGGATECSAGNYATPAVPIDVVSEDHRDALLTAIDELYPNGLTPAVPAVAGALEYAKQWAEDHPDRPTVLVWAADGFPTECDDTSISSLEDLAEEYGNGTPRVATFVVGLGPVANLERVADAGGTEAFFVSDCPTAIEDLLAALKRVSSSPTLCEFEVPEPPEGEFIDPDKVNVTFTTSSGSTEVVRKVPDVDSCSGGGWYFDDPDEPTTIHICPASCGRFGGGSIDIVLGCESVSLQ